MPRLSRRCLLPLAVGLLLLRALPVCESKRQLMLGRFFQMKRKEGGAAAAAAAAAAPHDASVPEDLVEEPLEVVRVDHDLLQEQVERTKILLQQQAQEFARLQQYVAELEPRLEDAEDRPPEMNHERDQRSADAAPAGVPPEDAADGPPEARRRGREEEWAARDDDMDSTLQDESRSAMVQNEELRSQLELYEGRVNELQSSMDAQVEGWNHEKKELMETNQNLLDELKAALEEKKSLEASVREIKEEASFWKSAFQNRAYINATHLTELGDILLSVATAPVVEAARSVYQNYVQDALDKGYEILAPLYDKFTAAVNVEFLAIPSKICRQKLKAALTECSRLWNKLWTRVVQDLTGIVQSSCEVGLKFTRDDAKRSKIQAICNDPGPIVLTTFAFQASLGPPGQAVSRTHQHVVPIDPSVAIDMGIAVASAAAGAASQIPRIQQLERELDVAKESLTASEQEMVKKITALEDRLHAMDQEFEEQTDRFKKKYDTKMRGELEKIKDKILTDYKYKLQIKLEEQKSQLLAEKLDFVNTVSGGKAQELVNLRIEKENMNRMNEKLEEALALSKTELDRLREEASTRKGWWPFG